MKKTDSKFQTHIREPRWQQILSVIIVVLGVLFWLGALIWNSSSH